MPFVTDTFTDTNGTLLQNHTGEVGATWTRHTSYSVNCAIQSNQCQASGNTSAYHASGTPGASEYDVSALLNCVLSGNDQYNGVAGRMSTSANTMYWTAYRQNGANQWVLYKIVAGAFTLLGSWNETLATGNTRTFKLEIRTAAKKLFVAGTERISSSDDAITATGRAGLRTQGPDNTSLRLEDFDASDPAGGGQTVTPGAIASAEAFGSVRVNQQVRPAAIVSAEAFGTARLILQILPSAIASGEAFGALKLNLRLLATALASAEAFGIPVVAVGGAQTIAPSAIASAEAFGSARLRLAIVSPSIATGEVFGTLRVSQQIRPSGIASGEALGAARLALVLLPAGIATAEAFGAGRLVFIVTPSGIATAEVVGTPTIIGGQVLVIVRRIRLTVPQFLAVDVRQH